jgi:hypothetical protein
MRSDRNEKRSTHNSTRIVKTPCHVFDHIQSRPGPSADFGIPSAGNGYYGPTLLGYEHASYDQLEATPRLHCSCSAQYPRNAGPIPENLSPSHWHWQPESRSRSQSVRSHGHCDGCHAGDTRILQRGLLATDVEPTTIFHRMHWFRTLLGPHWQFRPGPFGPPAHRLPRLRFSSAALSLSRARPSLVVPVTVPVCTGDARFDSGQRDRRSCGHSAARSSHVQPGLSCRPALLRPGRSSEGDRAVRTYRLKRFWEEASRKLCVYGVKIRNLSRILRVGVS